MVEKRIIFEGHSAGSKPSLRGQRENSQLTRIFLLSPANASGVRAQMLFSPRTQFDLVQRLRHPGVPLGEVYSFISGLYFRGKLAYAERFANPSPGIAGVYIITAGGGLMLPDSRVTLAELRGISATAVDPTNHEYRRPLDRDAYRLRTLVEPETEVVLLGSIATPKYVEPLLEVFEERLVFPKEFVGRGDMSRGGLLLRCCSEGLPLEYVPVRSTVRHGRRPPRLSAKGTQIRRRSLSK